MKRNEDIKYLQDKIRKIQKQIKLMKECDKVYDKNRRKF